MKGIGHKFKYNLSQNYTAHSSEEIEVKVCTFRKYTC